MTGPGIHTGRKRETAAEQLQERLAQLIPLRHFLATGFTRNGLFLLVKAMRWEQGAEIIIPAFTCPVIPYTVAETGLVPVPVDAEEDGINIDPDKIASSITERTRAIYVVHTYGMAAQIERICSIAKKHGLMVIEDLAHVPFSFYRGRRLGTFGDIALLSFTKKTINFEGGAIGTNDSSLYAKMIMLKREYQHTRSLSCAFLTEVFVRLVGSWWESRFSPIALLFMKLNDVINTIVYRGSYGISIDRSAFAASERGCRMTLRQIDRLARACSGSGKKFMKHTDTAPDILVYKPQQKDGDTPPFYITGIPAGRKKLYRLISFRTWHNSNAPGLYPRADYLYENYRIFSTAVLPLLPRRKKGAIRLIRNNVAESHTDNTKQTTLINKRGIV